MQLILDEGRVGSASAWSVAAGCTRVHVSTYLKRASVDPGASMECDAAVRLAKVAGVRVGWLVAGEGPMAAEGATPTPSLAAALAARLPGLAARAAAEALAREVDAPADVWDEFLEDVDRAEARVRKRAAKAAPGAGVATPPEVASDVAELRAFSALLDPQKEPNRPKPSAASDEDEPEPTPPKPARRKR